MPRRLATTVYLTAATLLLFAPVALADKQNDHGEGWYGETNDLAITYAGFILIAAFPLIALIGSLAYWQLEKRRLARVAAARSRAERADSRHGW